MYQLINKPWATLCTSFRRTWVCKVPNMLMQDPYANYVLQSALTVSNGQLHAQLVDAIRPYLPSLRGTPHGKRILSKINVKI